MSDIYLFGEDDAKRVKQWAYTDDGVIVARPRIIKGKSKFAFAQVKTGGISALSGSTAGSGTVTIQSSPSTTITATSVEVTAYNLNTDAYAAGEYVTIAQEMSTGKWIVLQGTGCPCGAGLVSLYETAGSGIPVSYKTTTSGSVKYELTFDSSTYSDGDQITVEFGITYLSSPVPSSIEMNLTSASNPLPPIISSNRPFTLVSSINSTNATTTLNTTSQFRLSKTQSSPSVGVKYTIDAVLDYTTDWSSVAESLECNGWLNYIIGGIGGGSGVFMAWEQC